MARLPRLSVPGHPHHVIQRGNNRQPVFRDGVDRQRLLDLLAEYAQQHEVAIHAYVLMDNHFHLLATPRRDGALSALMQGVGRRYVQFFNKRHQRSGTLWEGRFKATLVQSERYLLACMAYIDLNPVRAGLVAQAIDHPWSSHGHYTGVRIDRLVTPHDLYWTLGNTPFAREAAYADLVRAGVSSGQQAALTQSALKGWALGEPDFVASLQKQTPRRVSQARAGRPLAKPGR